MTDNEVPSQSSGKNGRVGLLFFFLLLAFSFWGVGSGWHLRGAPDGQGREAQTMISAQFIQQEGNFSLAYPMPVLGRPWSVPVEFPLYQWTAVAVSNLTGLGLMEAGRGVSVFCFYLVLPAFFLIVRVAGLSLAGGLMTVGLVASNAFYLDLASAFHGETMALLLGGWFLAGLARGMETGRRGWFGLAILAGVAVAMVDSRTFLVFLPAVAIGMAGLLRKGRQGSSPVARGARWWLVAAGILSGGAAWGWHGYAAGVRQLNPNSAYLSFIGLEGPGVPRPDFSSDLVERGWGLLGLHVVWWPLLLAGGALALTFSERWWRQVAVCAGVFLAAQILFPVTELSHLHELTAGVVWLLLALGFVLAGLFEPTLPRWVGPVALALACAGQAAQLHHLRQIGRPVLPSGQLVKAIRHAVPSGAYLVTVGAEADGLRLPALTQRRALVLTQAQVADEARLQAGFAALREEPLGACIIQGSHVMSPDILARLTALTGQEMQRVLLWRDCAVYLPVANIRPALDRLMVAALSEVVLAPESLPMTDQLAGGWREVGGIWAFQREVFRGMNPAPVGFFSSFGPGLTGEGEGEELWYNAHPITRLRFKLPAGSHRLRTRVMIQPGAFDPALPPNEMTDGVEFQLAAIRGDGARQVLHQRLIDPVNQAGDRQPQAIDVVFTLGVGAELELFLGPGPAGQATRDWVYLGRLRID